MMLRFTDHRKLAQTSPHMLHVIADIRLAPGKREEFLAEFRRIVAQVRAEDGCLEYGPTVDLPTGIAAQGEIPSDRVVIVEKWDSLDALRAHLAAPHMTEYRGRVKHVVQNVRLSILEPA
jgi:quinol monooxygenase YgiN